MSKKSISKSNDSSDDGRALKTSIYDQISKGKLVWICSMIILILAIAMRYFAFSFPVAGDEAVYGILGKKAMMGASLYGDIYEMKPPLLFYLYGISNLLFTWGQVGLRLTGLTLTLFNSFLIYKHSRIYKDRGTSLLIGSVCFFLLNNAFAYATETAAEHFMVAFILSGFYLLEKPVFKNFRLNILLAGFLIAGGAMVKQTAALYGIGSIFLVLWYSIRGRHPYKKKELVSNIISLALGAAIMICLNILPIVLNGSLAGAKYWLFDFPFSYVSSNSLGESLDYLSAIGGWILKYQFTTILLCCLGLLSIFLNYKKAYFPHLLILFVVSILAIFPGNRFYSQYWIPLLTLLPLSIISILDLVLDSTQKSISNIFIPILFLSSTSVDSFVHRDQYFTSNNLELINRTHQGNYPSIYFRMTEYLQKIMTPTDSFLMLGSEAFSYYMIDRFPKTNHIFPRSISRRTPENKIYQEDAIREMEEGKFDFLLLTVTGKSWQVGQDPLLDWYNEAFKFVKKDYEAILAYNLEEGQYYNYSRGDEINIYKPYQIIAFKRK